MVDTFVLSLYLLPLLLIVQLRPESWYSCIGTVISHLGLSYVIVVGGILFGLVYSQLSLCGEIVDLVSYPRSRVAGPPIFRVGA